MAVALLVQIQATCPRETWRNEEGGVNPGFYRSVSGVAAFASPAPHPELCLCFLASKEVGERSLFKEKKTMSWFAFYFMCMSALYFASIQLSTLHMCPMP